MNSNCLVNMNSTCSERVVSSAHKVSLTLAVVIVACLSACSSGSQDQEAPPAGNAWSDPSAWPSGRAPIAGEDVTIPAGTNLVLDVPTRELGRLTIGGSLRTSGDRDVGITAKQITIMDGGLLQIGEDGDPFLGTATITLTGARGQHTPRAEDSGLDNDGMSRGLRVMNGGMLSLHAEAPGLLKTKLNGHASAGSTTLTLADNVNWRAGDRIAISTTDFYGVGETEILTLAQHATGNTLQLTSGLATSRWGRIQYPIDTPINGSAMSLTPGSFTPADLDTPTVLDERAQIINLTRRIVIQGADDGDWTTDGFGAHVMVMGLRSRAQVDGVEFRRCGQRQAMGRYPFHWHMLSYSHANSSGSGGGAYLGDVVPSDHYLRNSSIVGSENRAVTIHGTCGVTVSDTFAVDIVGHAFFFEDGSERRNEMTDCVAMKVRRGTVDVKQHDGRASGFWLTNPDNTITRNTASDCVGVGLWNSFATSCFGHSRNVDLNPNSLQIGVFDDNVGHGNQRAGIMTADIVINEAGETEVAYYHPIGDEFEMERNQCWKNTEGGYKNRAQRPTYRSWTFADNSGIDAFGTTRAGALSVSNLFIGSSLNNASPFNEPRRRAIASYHFTLDVVNITAINYPFVAPAMTPNGQFVFGGGVFDTADLYLDSIALATFRNSGWRIINSNPGYLTPPPYFDGFPLAVGNGFRHWSVSGAIWDPHGFWGPAGNYLLATTNAFHTFGLSSSIPLGPGGQNGVSTPDVFFGLGKIQPLTDAPPWEVSDPMPVRLERLDSNGNVVGEHTIGDGATSTILAFTFKHFAVARGGRYRMVLLNGTVPEDNFNLVLDNAYRAEDWVLIGLPWNGAVPVIGRIDSGHDSQSLASRVSANTARELFATGTSIDDVLNDPSGATLWQDTASDTVWFKHVGGMALNVYGYDGRSDESLARPYQLRLRRQ